MAINLSALSQLAGKAVSLSNLLLVSPQSTVGYQPQNAPSWKKNTAAQPSALVFNYEGEQIAKISTDVTDHYIENNTAVQDQIAIKPNTITTHGFVGELNDIAPGILKPLQTAAEKLTIISGYAPALSVTALLAYANAFQAYQTAANLANTAVSAWATLTGGQNQTVINGSTQTPDTAQGQNQQQKYFQQFYGYIQNRTLFTVQTPWAVFQDMVITDLQAIQSAETNVITDFQITFKQLRFAATALQTPSLFGDSSNFQGRAAAQAAGVTDLGTSTLQPSSTSFTSLLAA